MSREQNYMVRFRLTRGGLAELPYHAERFVRPGDVISVSGWRIAVDTVARDATPHNPGACLAGCSGPLER